MQETARISALQAFVAWLVGRMDAPHNEEHGAQAAEARGKLLVLAFARLAFARVVEGLRAHGGTGPLKDELLQAQTALTAVVESLDESGCRRTLLLLGDESDQGLAHYTRAALAFSAYQRYTRDQVERVLVTTGAVKGSKASMLSADPELAQAYDELCAQTYRELRDAVWALCRASLASPPPFFTTQGD